MFGYIHMQTCFNVNISIAEYQVVGFAIFLQYPQFYLRQWHEKELDTWLSVSFAASTVQFREVPKHLKMLLCFSKSDWHLLANSSHVARVLSKKTGMQAKSYMEHLGYLYFGETKFVPVPHTSHAHTFMYTHTCTYI